VSIVLGTMQLTVILYFLNSSAIADVKTATPALEQRKADLRLRFIRKSQSLSSVAEISAPPRQAVLQVAEEINEF
jgi:hypothetical protein